MTASTIPSTARLATMAASESSQSGAVPIGAYTTEAPTSSRLRPNRSTSAPANGASRARASAGMLRASRVSASAPGVPAKWSCILGRTGAISTAPRMGRQLPAISRVAWKRGAGGVAAGAAGVGGAARSTGAVVGEDTV